MGEETSLYFLSSAYLDLFRRPFISLTSVSLLCSRTFDTFPVRCIHRYFIVPVAVVSGVIPCSSLISQLILWVYRKAVDL